MKIMKNKWFKSALLAVAGMSMTSCGDFLEIYPLTMVYEDNYWNEKNDVDQIVTGCYTRMQDDDFLRRLFIWGESRSDNTRRGFRSSFSATSNEGYILSENILSTNGYTDWSSFYSVIDRCNLVIEKAPQVAEIDPNYLPSDVQATIAEVTALRSLCYFYLVRAFKDVPYYTEAITNDEQELNLPATDGDVIVRTLIQDLLTVYPNALRVWPKQNGVDISYGRITQDAILAMVADMYLWLQDYANADKYAQMVIENKTEYFENNYPQSYMTNGYPLIPDYGGGLLTIGAAYRYTFAEGGGPESIFELDFTESTTDNSKSNDMMAEFFYKSVNQANPEPGLFAPAEGLWEEFVSPTLFFNKQDTRIKESMFVDGDQNNPELVYISKYVNETPHVTSSTGWRQSKNDANWIFYRVSDMMLIRAEALVCMMTDEENERNDSLGQVAFELVKAIEDRSCPNGESSIAYSNYSTKDLMLDLVYDARRREFLFEGKRWFDLVRRSRLEGNTTYLVDAVSDKFTENAATATGKLGNMMAIYWPYNYDELQVNPNLTQNPAYPEAGDSYESTN